MVEKNGIGESADAIWRSLNEEHQKLFPATQPANTEPTGEVPANGHSEAAELVKAAIPSASMLVFGQRPQELRGARWKPRAVAPEQASLFNWN